MGRCTIAGSWITVAAAVAAATTWVSAMIAAAAPAAKGAFKVAPTAATTAAAPTWYWPQLCLPVRKVTVVAEPVRSVLKGLTHLTQAIGSE